jgi:hypothetical protein
MRSGIPLLVLALLACGKTPNAKSGAGSDKVEQEVIIEKTPTGTRKTIITRTTRTVEAPSPPPRPADPFPDDPLVKYNADLLNSYRARAGAAPLLYDATISAFALRGSKQLADDHTPHAHFAAHINGAAGFGSHSAENQGDPNGVPALSTDALASGKKQIQLLLKLMFDEGPGGGHHDNMLNLKYRRVGVGLYNDRGLLYLTNDFSD